MVRGDKVPRAEAIAVGEWKGVGKRLCAGGVHAGRGICMRVMSSVVTDPCYPQPTVQIGRDVMSFRD